MPEAATTETPTTPTEGTPSSETTETTLLTGTEVPATTQQQTETQTEEPKTEEVKTEEVKVEGAPEKYEFKAPEGKTYDPAVVEPFAAAAKEANLSQSVAQAMLDKMAPVVATRLGDQVKAEQTRWLESTKSDPEIGGVHLAENVSIANKAVRQFAPPVLQELLKTTGFANHPEFIRMFVKIGKGMSEDKFVTGQGSSTSSKSTAEILYDKT